PNEIERADGRITQIITKAENHFKQGQANLSDNRREQARDEFDHAVDVVLESGIDVRANPRLQNFYLELVERIYRLEVPAPVQQTPAAAPEGENPTLVAVSQTDAAPKVQQIAARQIGFREQKFEPSPLDELSRLTLTSDEQNVSPQEVADLELAKNSINFPFNTNPLIQQFINYYQGRGRATMENGLRRAGRYLPMARRIFREEGVPEDIVWLGQVESAWRPVAVSYMGAAGLWQFMPYTGADYGLRQTAWVDERNSFEKATRASARYLKYLARYFNGNWELAIGAYNTGPGNIERGIRRAGAADFWQVYPYIAQETRNYVPNILATILIAKNPEKYGFRNIRPEAPLSYETVRVPTATGLQLIADATDTNVDYIRSINPELRRDVTPRGDVHDVRVPAGKGKQFVAILKRIPLDQRETARVISASPGENMQQIASRTGTNLTQLIAWNGNVDTSNGGKIVLPKGSVRNTALIRPKMNIAGAASPAGTAPGPKRLVKIRARAGDTVAALAKRYNASADEVAKLNGITAAASLRAGQEVMVPTSK
ncbi:MAG TPA: transglycosylase SLT domain-containing protein, partial [Pyrinomonadaceae bacterium]|nr:transglycosylase SLT domain-containing protein [Pyrinomonadaceae bacterium]